MRFKTFLNESPANLMNADDLPIARRSNDSILEYIKNVKSKYKLFGNFAYNIIKHKDKKILVLFENEVQVAYILYKEQNKSMFIELVQNVSKIKALTFKVYAALLTNKIFNKIYTGDSLTTKNIKAHKKYLLSSNFNLYISSTKNEIKIETAEEFDKIIKDSNINTQFVLKDSSLIENVLKTYSSFEGGRDYENISELINFYVSGDKK